jgi:UDP-glucuronate 4-epimerase
LPAAAKKPTSSEPTSSEADPARKQKERRLSNERQAVLVTGAGGFIGSRVVAELHRQRRWVIGTDVARPANPPAEGVDFYVADVRDITRHAAVIARRCDSIVHCGGISGPMLMEDNPGEVLDINVRGTHQLLSLASSMGLRRFVGLSSVAAYGNTPGRDLVDETAPLTASTFYGTSKAATDLMLQTYVQTLGLSATALRIGWVYGPGRVTDAIIQPIVRSARGEPYRMSTGGDHLLQLVHVDDVVAAILAALDAPQLPRPAYNINGLETVQISAMRDMIAAQLPSIRAEIGPGPLEGADLQGKMSVASAQRDLGWIPKVSFTDGLSRYVDWLQHHPY